MSESRRKMELFLEPRASHQLRIKLQDGSLFVVREIFALDKSIYGLDGGWCGEIMSVAGLAPAKQKLFKIGSGVDLYEKDIIEIFDETTEEFVYQLKR